MADSIIIVNIIDMLPENLFNAPVNTIVDAAETTVMAKK